MKGFFLCSSLSLSLFLFVSRNRNRTLFPLGVTEKNWLLSDDVSGVTTLIQCDLRSAARPDYKEYCTRAYETVWMRANRSRGLEKNFWRVHMHSFFSFCFSFFSLWYEFRSDYGRSSGRYSDKYLFHVVEHLFESFEDNRCLSFGETDSDQCAVRKKKREKESSRYF